MDLRNSTDLDTERLHRMFVGHTHPYRHDGLKVRVRHSRGADFSGTCYYGNGRILINLGRHNRYPYTLATNIAKAKSNGTHWWRPTYRLTVADPYQLALFVYLHELYHYLVKAAKRSPRRKEAMSDRFATRVLVDYYGCRVCDTSGRRVARETWDFKDLDAFVVAAPRQKPAAPARARPRPGPTRPRARAVPADKAGPSSTRQIPVTIRGAQYTFDFGAALP
jgi:hypothetical protein